MARANRGLRAIATVTLLWTVLGQCAAQDLHYHLRRAVFRCSPMNRGLAFDGKHFWVGEFGGWVRCYDLQGQHLPARDLGGGTIQYLGHGVATGEDFVATGALGLRRRAVAGRWADPSCEAAGAGKSLRRGLAAARRCG